ncbi:unnamed protein product [Amoebophrya sp. A25]|nr:unnamed protein product [Amoebophrya sp. A25]|eukprot:GSA25T00010853001.1
MNKLLAGGAGTREMTMGSGKRRRSVEVRSNAAASNVSTTKSPLLRELDAMILSSDRENSWRQSAPPQVSPFQMLGSAKGNIHELDTGSVAGSLSMGCSAAQLQAQLDAQNAAQQPEAFVRALREKLGLETVFAKSSNTYTTSLSNLRKCWDTRKALQEFLASERARGVGAGHSSDLSAHANAECALQFAQAGASTTTGAELSSAAAPGASSSSTSAGAPESRLLLEEHGGGGASTAFGGAGEASFAARPPQIGKVIVGDTVNLDATPEERRAFLAKLRAELGASDAVERGAGAAASASPSSSTSLSTAARLKREDPEDSESGSSEEDDDDESDEDGTGGNRENYDTSENETPRGTSTTLHPVPESGEPTSGGGDAAAGSSSTGAQHPLAASVGALTTMQRDHNLMRIDLQQQQQQQLAKWRRIQIHQVPFLVRLVGAGTLDGIEGIALCAGFFSKHRYLTDAMADMELAQRLAQVDGAARNFALLILRSGRFSGAIFSAVDGRLLLHKNFRRYTVRAKQGGGQSAKDNTGKSIKSAGSQLRRYGEQQLENSMRTLFQSWRGDLRLCGGDIFLSGGHDQISTLVKCLQPVVGSTSDGSAPLEYKKLPIMVNKPALAEIEALALQLRTVHIFRQGDLWKLLQGSGGASGSPANLQQGAGAGGVNLSSGALGGSKARDGGDNNNAGSSKRKKVNVEEAKPAPAPEYHSDDDREFSALHRAARDGNAVEVERLLTAYCEKQKANPPGQRRKSLLDEPTSGDADVPTSEAIGANAFSMSPAGEDSTVFAPDARTAKDRREAKLEKEELTSSAEAANGKMLGRGQQAGTSAVSQQLQTGRTHQQQLSAGAPCPGGVDQEHDKQDEMQRNHVANIDEDGDVISPDRFQEDSAPSPSFKRGSQGLSGPHQNVVPNRSWDLESNWSANAAAGGSDTTEIRQEYRHNYTISTGGAGGLLSSTPNQNNRIGGGTSSYLQASPMAGLPGGRSGGLFGHLGASGSSGRRFSNFSSGGGRQHGMLGAFGIGLRTELPPLEEAGPVRHQHDLIASLNEENNAIPVVTEGNQLVAMKKTVERIRQKCSILGRDDNMDSASGFDVAQDIDEVVGEDILEASDLNQQHASNQDDEQNGLAEATAAVEAMRTAVSDDEQVEEDLINVEDNAPSLRGAVGHSPVDEELVSPTSKQGTASSAGGAKRTQSDHESDGPMLRPPSTFGGAAGARAAGFDLNNVTDPNDSHSQHLAPATSSSRPRAGAGASKAGEAQPSQRLFSSASGHQGPTDEEQDLVAARDGKGRVPYYLAANQKVREAFRRVRGKFPDAFDWDAGQVPPGITDDSEAAKKAKEKEKRQRQKAKAKENKGKKKEEELKKQEEAAKKAKEEAELLKGPPCANCSTNCGTNRSKWFRRLEYIYCSSDCVKAHQRKLAADAAAKRFAK